MLTIYAPGIEVGITDKSKIDFACEVTKTIMGNVFYNDELTHDVITIHNVKSYGMKNAQDSSE